MRVIATAGHVDHGKSALVHALTGMQPDRWQAERDRGLTIDLGFAWTDLEGLDGARTIAFVDVPGHERFIGNMVAGIGPAAAVVFIVAADEGWSAQSSEHLAALHALQVDRGLLVITKADLADPAATLAQARRRLAGTSLAGLPDVAVSVRTGAGLPELRAALYRLAETIPVPQDQRVRLWLDRSFSIRGAGTVVTGTLPAGQITAGDQLTLCTAAGARQVRARSLQSLDQTRQQVSGPARVAVNLPDVTVADVGRGDVLLGPGWATTAVLDARFAPAPGPAAGPAPGADPHAGPPASAAHAGDGRPSGASEAQAGLPRVAMLHVGTAALQARLQPLADDVLRVHLPQPLPLVPGDRAILRSPGGRVLGGLLVIDADPPPLRRRGAGRRRGAELATATGRFDLAAAVRRRGVLPLRDAVAATGPGQLPTGQHAESPQEWPGGVARVGDFLVDEEHWADLARRLAALTDQHAADHPLDPTLSAEAARTRIGLPDRSLLPPLVEAAGVSLQAGRISRPGTVARLGAAEAGLAQLEERLRSDPFAAPEADALAAAGLGRKQLAAAATAGRILRLPGDIVLLPDAPARAMRILAALPQPFTLSQARQALGSTRRVVVPLLEFLDGRGWTRRVDSVQREVVRGTTPRG